MENPYLDIFQWMIWGNFTPMLGNIQLWGENPHDFWTFGEIPMTSETSIAAGIPTFQRLVTRSNQPNSGSNNYPAW